MANELGFDGILINSMNAVADRDFVLEALFWGNFLLALLSIEAPGNRSDDRT